jgi:hypothetical protein
VLNVAMSTKPQASTIWTKPDCGTLPGAVKPFIRLSSGAKRKPSKPAGCCTSAGAVRPTAASMHTRPCSSSAARRQEISKVFDRPRRPRRALA